MSKSKYTTAVCVAIVVVMLLTTVAFAMGESLGITAVSADPAYVSRLFSTDRVHTLDIVVDESDWQGILDNASAKEYIMCNLVIDGEKVSNVAIRTKGNSSLSTIAMSDTDRYSFKIEFDHYNSAQTYYGLDKLALNNIAQDNTYMKDYLSYQLMNYFGANSPLSSFIYITVNGEDWGLYLAVEGIEEAFAQRNYGNNYGEIYKPDSMDMNNMGGGNNGGGIAMPDMSNMTNMPDMSDISGMLEQFGVTEEDIQSFMAGGDLPDELAALAEQFGIDVDAIRDTQINQNFTDGSQTTTRQRGRDFTGGGMIGGFGGSGNDVALVYSDDEQSSYPNIFDNAMFNPTDADKDRLIASLKQISEGENLDQVIDIDEVLRYFVVHNFVLNFDSYTGSMMHNYYLYEENGQLSMIAWDYNLAFGAFSMGGMFGSDAVDSATSVVNYPIDTPVSGTTLEARPLLGQLFADEDYLNQYHELFAEFISGMFDSGLFEEKINKTVTLISPYVEKDPTAFCTYDEFVAATAALKEFCLLRAQSVQLQLDGVIPSTSEGQSADSSSFVDASAVDINSMGSQNSGFGRARGGENWNFARPGTQSNDSESAPPAEDIDLTPEADPAPAQSDDSAQPASLSLTGLSANAGGGMNPGGQRGQPGAQDGTATGEWPQGGMSGMVPNEDGSFTPPDFTGDGSFIPPDFSGGGMPTDDAVATDSSAAPAETAPPAEQSSGGEQTAAQSQWPDMSNMGDMSNFSNVMGNQNNSMIAAQTNSIAAYIELGAAVLVLVVGILLAKKLY